LTARSADDGHLLSNEEPSSQVSIPAGPDGQLAHPDIWAFEDTHQVEGFCL
jgi:hypothetical protein